jgi:S1-C subfamily serine protease
MDDAVQRTLNVINNATREQNPPAPCKVDTVDKSNVELLDAFSRAVIIVVETIGPAIVSISTGTRSKDAEPEEGGAGSGVIIAPDGYILTHDHAVHGSTCWLFR